MAENLALIFQTLFKQTADGMILSNQDGSVQDCNPAFCSLIGRKKEEIVNRPLAEFVDLNTQADLDNAKNENEINAKQAIILCASGLNLIMPLTHIPLPHSTQTSIQGSDSQGSGVDFLTLVYIVQAQSVQQAQTEFVSTVSHELRTPLTSIKGFADTILRAGDRLDHSAQRRYIGIIKDQADRLTRLVEDLLAVSRLESRKMQLTIRAINFEETVDRVCQNLTEKAKGHKLNVKIAPGLPQVWADADRLEQILTNLIDNAIKYSPANTTVTISARVLHQEPEMVEFSVCDQGGGISQDYLSQIFNKFSRQDNPLTRQTEGTGLGLYITKSLVLALEGTISVTSEPGTTTFTVQIPAATLEQQAARGRGKS